MRYYAKVVMIIVLQFKEKGDLYLHIYFQELCTTIENGSIKAIGLNEEKEYKYISIQVKYINSMVQIHTLQKCKQ